MSIINTIKASIKEAATEMKLIKSSKKTAQERAKDLQHAIALKAVLEHDLEQAEREERAKSILAGQQKKLEEAESHVKKLTDDKKAVEKLGSLATEQLKTLIGTLESINKLDKCYSVGTYDFSQVFRNNTSVDSVKNIVPVQHSVNPLAHSKPTAFDLAGGNDIKRAIYLRDEAKKALDNSVENIEVLIDEQIQGEKPNKSAKQSNVKVQVVDMHKGTSERTCNVNQTVGG